MQSLFRVEHFVIFYQLIQYLYINKDSSGIKVHHEHLTFYKNKPFRYKT